MGTSAILLPFSITAPVMQKMIGLILGMDSLTSVDVFLITCKVNYFDVELWATCVSWESCCPVILLSDGDLYEKFGL